MKKLLPIMILALTGLVFAAPITETHVFTTAPDREFISDMRSELYKLERLAREKKLLEDRLAKKTAALAMHGMCIRRCFVRYDATLDATLPATLSDVDNASDASDDTLSFNAAAQAARDARDE